MLAEGVAKLIVVTGRPGSGKSTLCGRLMSALRETANYHHFSRDDFKRLYLAELGADHDSAPPNTNQVATDNFIQAVRARLDAGKNVIADAAFQHPLWQTILSELENVAEVRIIVCELTAELALERYDQRLKDSVLENGIETFTWQQIHGSERPDSLIKEYEKPLLAYPTTIVNTAELDLDIAELIQFFR